MSEQLEELITLLRSEDESDAHNARKALYKQGLFRDGSLEHCDLSGTNLRGAPIIKGNLRFANLAAANLQQAMLWDADLEGTNLTDADLQGTDFRRANLRDANLSGAVFSENTILPDTTENHYAPFKNWSPDVDMTCYTDPKHPHFWHGYGLSAQELHDKDFSNKNFRGAYLKESGLNNVLFTNSDLEATSFVLASMTGAQMVNANLKTAEFYSTHLEDAVFVGSALQDAGLKHSDLRNTNFDKSVLSGAKFHDSDLQNASFVGADLQGAQFINANLLGADFTDAVFNEDTILPDETLWTPEIDLSRFTDAKHADFWAPTPPELN